MMRSKWLVAGAGVVISVVLLWAAFRNLQPDQVWASIQQADMPLLLIAAAWYFAAVIVVALRWQALLNTTQRVPLAALAKLVCVGYAGNNIYPFRSGELLRIILLQRSHKVPLARSTTVVLVERVFDGVVLLSFVLFALLLMPNTGPEIRTGAMLATPVFIVALVVFFILAARPNLLIGLAEQISRLLPASLRPRLMHLASEISEGLAGLRTPADLAGAVINSYGTWIIQATVFWLVAFAFNLDLDLVTMLLAVGVVNLAGLIPASPGQFGVFESLTVLVVTAQGVPETLALAYALSVHMIIWLPVTLVGLFYLFQQGLGLSAITQAQQFENQTPA